MFQFSPIKKNIDSVIAAAFGFFIIFLFTRHSGIGVCPDGVEYISGAENIRANGTYADFGHGHIIDFPAFYSIFLSSIMWLTGVRILAFAPYLNALLFAATIFLAGNIMEQFQFKSKIWKAAVLTCIVLSPGLLEDYSMMWSETIFILFLLLFMMAINRYLNSDSRKALIAAAVVTALACVTRYAGICIIACGGIIILLNSNISWQKRIIDGFIFGIVSCSLLAINFYRNNQVSGTFTGFREKSITPFTQNLHDTGIVFSNWLPFPSENNFVTLIIPSLIIVGLFILCLKNFLKNKRIVGFENLAVFFALFYILFMIITATISRFETLNSRFITPAFIFLLWAASSWLIPFILKKSAWAKTAAIGFGICLFFFFQYGQLAADAETWDGVKDAGIPGYTEDGWTKSPTVLFVEKDLLPFKKNYTIYSDANDAIYWFTHKQGLFLPAKEYKPGVESFLKDPHCYVVWFNDGENTELVDKNFLTQVKKMKLVEEFDDGCIYEYDVPAITQANSPN